MDNAILILIISVILMLRCLQILFENFNEDKVIVVKCDIFGTATAIHRDQDSGGSEIEEVFVEKLTTQNVLSFYQIFKLFNLPSFNKTIFSFIERCFQTIVETECFLNYN